LGRFRSLRRRPLNCDFVRDPGPQSVAPRLGRRHRPAAPAHKSNDHVGVVDRGERAIDRSGAVFPAGLQIEAASRELGCGLGREGQEFVGSGSNEGAQVGGGDWLANER